MLMGPILFVLAQAGTAATGNAQPSIIEHRRDPVVDIMLEYRVFDGGQIVVDPQRLTHRQWYMLLGMRGVTLPESVAIRCAISPSGQVSDYTCDNDVEDDAAAAGVAVARSLGLIAAQPSYSPEPKPKLRHYREVRYRLVFEKFTPPGIDLTKGPLVSKSQVFGLRYTNLNMVYPTRALREERQGRQTVECQVQADYSLICNPVAFDPAENGPYFAEVARRLFAPVPVAAQLADGGPSAYARFRFSINWAIPKDQPEPKP